MPGIKIINVLKDDSLSEILELFRQAPVGEVIFVLPRTCKVFKREDHFAAFASEAAEGGKTISILTSNPGVAAMARAFKFNVMNSGKSKEEPGTIPATLTSSPPPADDDIPDDNADTAPDRDSRVVGTSDETMDTTQADEDDAAMPGFHVEDENGPVDDNEDGNADEPKASDMSFGDDADLTRHGNAPVMATLAAVDGVRKVRRVAAAPAPKKAAPAPTEDIDVPISRAQPAEPMMEVEEEAPVVVAPAPVAAAPKSAVAADLDYIDAVWRQKAAASAGMDITPVTPVAKRSWMPSWHMPSLTSLHTSKRMVTGALVLAVLLLGLAVYLTAGSAQVSINPQGRALDMQMTVQASDVFSTVDTEFSKIPGQLFEVSKSATSTRDATGQRDVASKARVKITISNEYSSTPQALVATTRFATPEGLVFRTLQTVNVPGSTVKEGKPVAGTVTVDAIADKPGTSYNVPAGKWTIVAFTEKGDTERAGKIYGTTTDAASGGASGPSKVVTQADYDNARTEAVATVKTQITDAFKQQQTGLHILDEAQPELGAVTSTANPDDAATTVTVTAAGTLRTVAFRQEDLDKLIRDTVLAKERLVVVPGELTLTYSDVAFKSDTGVLVFSVNLKGMGYTPIDEASIKSDIRGKSAQQVRDYFAQRDGIDSATVSTRPFWVRSIPTKDSKIRVDINYGRPAGASDSR